MLDFLQTDTGSFFLAVVAFIVALGLVLVYAWIMNGVDQRRRDREILARHEMQNKDNGTWS